MLHITTRHSGKMAGMTSVNTSALGNEFCVAQSCGICKSCYAKAGEAMRPTMKNKFMENNAALVSPIASADLPYFNARYVRFHAFGELLNADHYLNFVNIARKNPDTKFALWTKRKNLVAGVDRPANMVLIFSENRLNVPDPEVPAGFNKVFAVYTADYLKENPATDINCGARSCVSCLRCYASDDTIIREKRKGGK
jgi:hypothetical protein